MGRAVAICSRRRERKDCLSDSCSVFFSWVCRFFFTCGKSLPAIRNVSNLLIISFHILALLLQATLFDCPNDINSNDIFSAYKKSERSFLRTTVFSFSEEQLFSTFVFYQITSNAIMSFE